MRAARQRLAEAKELHQLESLASGWLPIEMLRELASLPLIPSFTNNVTYQ